ncbi:TonB-dependent receptor [Sphingobacterium alkalisoli]|uniref:TonB-dependent receptor n=1 Tax=Sphingobacterium alkalisoli TaxID=1874115 RepID=A0A4U0H8L1_9SPHI|nr:TonB-dependent receptor [Sphingobacterium alkalisoli]TJY68203.1 TonB-dependent receptor [Sphingobacterium alkalisoli]GGH08280.1 SusC/RagA family TonB-linked outer membrane protein [Sphingobacterium alkalisoli]
MKKYILCIGLAVLAMGQRALAQQGTEQVVQEEVTITGRVTDINSEPLMGVSISISNAPGLGARTDEAGLYSLKVRRYQTLVFTYVGYDKVEVLLNAQPTIDVTMNESGSSVIDQVVVTATGNERRIAVTGAITTVDVERLKSNPSTSMADALAGQVPGILAMQRSGRPGEISEFWIRGISTFGASSAALILVDGFERDMNEVNVEDVESFTVLKDASATAIYGSRGANGVVLINTKRGKEGKIAINAKLEGFRSQFTKLPTFADGYTYASMANEAKTTRNQEPLYSAAELEILRLGLDPDLLPSVDWMDVLLRDNTYSNRSQLSMSGGGKTARYYVGGSYHNMQGMYKVDDAISDYNTNTNFRRYTYRLNVDMDITPTTLLRVGVSGSLRKENDPGVGTNAIWTSLMGYNPVMMPLTYTDGRIASWTSQGDNLNPWVQGTMTGYRENWDNNIQTNLNLEQKLDFITPGLRFVGRFGYDTKNWSSIHRFKRPETWKIERFRNQGELVFFRTGVEQVMTQSSSSDGSRRDFLEWDLLYNKRLGKHNFGAVAKYMQSSEVFTQGIGSDLKRGIARRIQGISGRANYNFNNRYFVDFNFGYTGSENFHRDNRFGFFPAFSGAWNVAEEPFLKEADWVNMFKIRYSHGKTGNDRMGPSNNPIRFPYLYDIETMSGGGYQFGNTQILPENEPWINGMRYSSVASPHVTWEVATKKNLGMDFSFLNDKISGVFDLFDERRDGIYMTRMFLPNMVGLESNPQANVGSVKSRGFDGNIDFKQKFNTVDLTLRGNMTYSKNEILARDEQNTIYNYRLQQGHRVDQARGLVALGLFKDYDDIRNSPTQQFGEVMPGDIKYKDINGDGIVDATDVTAIGATTRPNLIYGFGMSISWKGIDLNVLFQGAGKSSYFINGSSVYMFQGGDGWGNVLTELANSNRWILGVNEDPNADYPRLSYGANSNNYRASSLWLRDGSYMRLKNLDIGYSLPKHWVNRARLNSARIFFVGTNLLTFSAFKLWDPEMGNPDGKVYGLSQTLSLGLQVNL